MTNFKKEFDSTNCFLGDCSYSGMAIGKAGVLALFDVDGTLTAPRKVLLLFPRLNF